MAHPVRRTCPSPFRGQKEKERSTWQRPNRSDSGITPVSLWKSKKTINESTFFGTVPPYNRRDHCRAAHHREAFSQGNSPRNSGRRCRRRRRIISRLCIGRRARGCLSRFHV